MVKSYFLTLVSIQETVLLQLKSGIKGNTKRWENQGKAT